ncbi:hypothetical protein PoB_003883400 [Plakobranchus ocellatus]|uniref:Uncharacterized protein n=1 Tax=Plakobranchus ocellatus TaxID=259542 RepID=A0AAV4B1T5_9GAST|nr:hypothetical protein PoB_003883400 [Plakobranchus ocellatus]
MQQLHCSTVEDSPCSNATIHCSTVEDSPCSNATTVNDSVNAANQLWVNAAGNFQGYDDTFLGRLITGDATGSTKQYQELNEINASRYCCFLLEEYCCCEYTHSLSACASVGKYCPVNSTAHQAARTAGPSCSTIILPFIPQTPPRNGLERKAEKIKSTLIVFLRSDSTSSNNHFSGPLEYHLARKNLNNSNEIAKAVNECLKSLEKHFFRTAIYSFGHRWEN